MILTQVFLTTVSIALVLAAIILTFKKLYKFFQAITYERLNKRANKDRQDLSEFIAALITAFAIVLTLAILTDLYQSL